ncbi:MAG: RluA family pseudouridine synthase [Paludibacteraceae bacterium]|nr:RluA family pseudouridine synthase [Paludibacteraceae bacterium]MBP5457566.1 RluA family pseudouridine synthase [Paludibacteraceae bacterium]
MEILYEDNHVIVVNKASSEIVQADKSGDIPLSEMVKEYLKEKYQKPGNVFLGITHRIDRPVSGAVLFAKTSKALTRLNDMFRYHSNLKKQYWAIVKNLPPQDEMTLVHYLTRNERLNKTFASEERTEGSKKSILSFRRIADSDNYHLLEIDLKTGRHHQIRCQLSTIGCPIKGDTKYGFPRSNTDGGISLHARYLEFIHPVSKKLIGVEAPLPNDILWDEFARILDVNPDGGIFVMEPEEYEQIERERAEEMKKLGM